MSNISGTRAVPTGWVGWVVFAGLMMIINGFLNAISGIAAIAKDEVYVVGRHASVLLDVTAFGWIHLVLGIVVAVSGFFVIRGASWAIWVAVVVTSLNMLTQMMQLPSYPFWALLIITVDVLVLWALIVHGSEATELE
jgi:hypothetical protein